MAVFILFGVNIAAFFSMVYSIDYMKQVFDRWKYYILVLTMITGVNGVIISGDIFTLYIFLEVGALSSYILLCFSKGARAFAGCFGYMLKSVFASALILLAIALIYSYLSTLNMADIAKELITRNSSMPCRQSLNLVTIFISSLFLIGFAVKAGMFPFQQWISQAYICAPASVSALIFGVLIPAVGIYPIMRLFFNVIGTSGEFLFVITVLGIISVFAGIIFALFTWNFKRIVSYHILSEFGYVLLGLGIATRLGILAGLVHLFNCVMLSLLLSFNSGALEQLTKITDLRKMDQINKKSPFLTFTICLGSISMVGIPPFIGFLTKLFIFFAALEAGFTECAVWIIIVNILALSSVFKVNKFVVFSRTKNKGVEILPEIPLSMSSSMIALAVLSLVGILLWSDFCKQIFLMPVFEVIREGTQYAEHIFGVVK